MNDSKNSEAKPGSISISGDVGPGAAIGQRASVTAKNIAGGDINIGAEAASAPTQEEFVQQLTELQKLLDKMLANQEITPPAETAIKKELAEVAAEVDSEIPDKDKIVEGLNRTSKILDGVAGTAKAVGGAGAAALKALPILMSLTKIAKALF